MVAWSDELDRVDGQPVLSLYVTLMNSYRDLSLHRILAYSKPGRIHGYRWTCSNAKTACPRDTRVSLIVLPHFCIYGAFRPTTHHAFSSQCSIISDASDCDTRHLSLIFFDVLLVDSQSLLSVPYTRRRALLSSIISPLVPGRVMLAESWPIDMSRGMNEGARQLREVFAESLAGFEEGLVLKDGNSGWRDWRRPWVKVR